MGYKVGRPAPFPTSYMVGLEDKRTNNRTMLPTLKNNAAASYTGPVKIELSKGAGPLHKVMLDLLDYFEIHVALKRSGSLQ